MNIWNSIHQPVLLLDETRCRANILRMVLKAREAGVMLRPHFKTHQSAIIGTWFREAGVEAITVSSVGMARYFADAGWTDITIAFPLNIRELDDIMKFPSHTSLHLLVSSVEILPGLQRMCSRPLGVFTEIDTGYHRSGLLPAQTREIEAIIRSCTDHPFLSFRGFLSHFGETYQVSSADAIPGIVEHHMAVLEALRSRFFSGKESILSIGDTPSFSILTRFPGVDEVRPGNAVFYDLMQHQIGACDLSQIALCLAVPVVEVHHGRNELVVYGGAVHLSKEHLTQREGRVFGLVVEPEGDGWSDPVAGARVISLSQEHGVIHAPQDWISRKHPGDLIGILPVHACLTAHAMHAYLTLDGRHIPMM